MNAISIGLSLIALATIAMELTLTRVFDAILTPNLAYMVITGAVFGFGLAGVYAVFRPMHDTANIRHRLAALAFTFGLASALLRPVLNLHFD